MEVLVEIKIAKKRTMLKKGADDQKETENIKKVLTIGRAFALASTISFQLAIPILMGVFGGRYLDDRFGTQPWLMITGMFLGLAAGIAGVVRVVQGFFGER